MVVGLTHLVSKMIWTNFDQYADRQILTTRKGLKGPMINSLQTKEEMIAK